MTHHFDRFHLIAMFRSTTNFDRALGKSGIDHSVKNKVLMVLLQRGERLRLCWSQTGMQPFKSVTQSVREKLRQYYQPLCFSISCLTDCVSFSQQTQIRSQCNQEEAIPSESSRLYLRPSCLGILCQKLWQFFSC